MTKATIEEGNHRLMKLAHFLRDMVHPSKFNYHFYVSRVSGEGFADPHKMAERPSEEGDCGTVACAMGWTPVLWPDVFRWATLNDIEETPAALVPAEPGRIGFISVAKEFFCLSEEEYLHVFENRGLLLADGANATPDMVADHIIDFVLSRH